MSEYRRQRITVQPREIFPTDPGFAPTDIVDAVADNWDALLGGPLGTALDSKLSTWETGTAYLDGATALYVVYGTTDDWEATRTFSSGTTSTGAGQAGAPPTTLAALKLLTYS